MNKYMGEAGLFDRLFAEPPVRSGASRAVVIAIDLLGVVEVELDGVVGLLGAAPVHLGHLLPVGECGVLLFSVGLDA